MKMTLTQRPNPGDHRLYFRGDIVEFSLELSEPIPGKAFLRTNLERAFIKRKEIVLEVDSGRPRRAQDWHDIPMVRIDDYRFRISIALLEVGHFEGKCCFFPQDSPEPLWPSGDNVHINVEAAEYCCANSIYCAFTRQFGVNKNLSKSNTVAGVPASTLEILDKAGYSVIPPSGTFRDLIKELDFIICRLNCRILHLLPINPTPTVYARMGRYGSPYAALDFTAIDPSLAEFDRKATPLDQFLELVDAVHLRDAKIFIDIAINHTGWAAKLHEEHPEWLLREKDGSIHSPGAWGVVWGDLTELDHSCKELWSYLADEFMLWCERGVDGFRCDAGYMIPEPAWKYIIARVRQAYPNTIFLLEGLGGDPKVTSKLLNTGNMNWAYSELFQNYSRQEIESYVTYANNESAKDGLMVHYAETHDNKRLAETSEDYARMRTALCALLSNNGTFGFTNGVEWFAKEKIDVHEASALNWSSKSNQTGHIASLNRILITHPAFHPGSTLRFIDSGNPEGLAVVRADHSNEHFLLILVNLNCSRKNEIRWSREEFPFKGRSVLDLIENREIMIRTSERESPSLILQPGEVFCLASANSGKEQIDTSLSSCFPHSRRTALQCARALALEIVSWKNKTQIVSGVDFEGLENLLLDDPVNFLSRVFCDGEIPVVRWRWPEDQKRQFMVPPNNILMLSAPYRFRAAIVDGNGDVIQRDSLVSASGEHFAFFIRTTLADEHHAATLKLAVFRQNQYVRSEFQLLFLARELKRLPEKLSHREVRDYNGTFLSGNGRGGMLRPCLRWGELRSRYDAILAANLSCDHPEDRHIMWRRCRLWIVHHARTQEFSIDSVESFYLNQMDGGTWEFHLPVGNGFYVDISVAMSMLEDRNAVKMNIVRRENQLRPQYLDDQKAITLILRPDVEDRNFHHETKASHGPERDWPGKVSSSTRSFTFAPSEARKLLITSSKGSFQVSNEWHYSISHPIESERGLEAHGDLFSPGYFEISLGGGEELEIVGQVLTPMESSPSPLHASLDLTSLLSPAESEIYSICFKAIDQFVVKRGELKTVIAGYPWFLDWGRDTLICARGLIAAGKISEVEEILIQFAKFAENGTIPNMIHGDNASNRDTSDAPLWLFVACEDFCRATRDDKFLSRQIRKGVKMIDVLVSIAEGYIKGTPNGIKVDPSTSLVFSPSHFTWMDTNFPAGTPREGYPIEIQALWYAATCFLSQSVEDNGKWCDLAENVKKSIRELYPLTNKGYLSDCLHCESGVSAKKAIADDHLRPNQLFAITLGALDDMDWMKNVLRSSYDLLVPGAIRSLGTKAVEYQLPIYGNDGQLLNDPGEPYWGSYIGDEDTRRKPAYHNGTAWTWPFPSYCEAYYMVYGEIGAKTARSILSSSSILMERGCFGQFPEIVDGDYPHTQKGCDAQAWGATEWYRVWKMLNE